MIRNTDHQFVPTDSNALLRSLVLLYQGITGQTLSPAAPERVFVNWVANAMLILLNSTNFVGNQNLPSRASGENLDALGEIFQNTRRPLAQSAVSTVRFHITSSQLSVIHIPVGTRVADISNLVRWQTTADALIQIGETSVDVPVSCLTPGAIGNGFIQGQINTLLDIGNIPHFESCENITISEGGADEADDETYFNLLRESQDSYSTAGPRGGYIYHARKVSTEIRDVVAVSPKPGQVDLYVIMQDGSLAGEEMKNLVYLACNADDVRPLTDYVTMQDAEIVEYDIDITYFVPSRLYDMSLSDIEKVVDDAVADYIDWQSGMLGRDIVPDALHFRLKQTGVIKRIEIRSPIFEVLRDGRSSDENTKPQIAELRRENINVVNGGYEDE